MKKMIVLMIGLGVILGGCRKKEKQEAASGQTCPTRCRVYVSVSGLSGSRANGESGGPGIGIPGKDELYPGSAGKSRPVVVCHRTSTLSGSVESGTGRNEEYRGTSGLRQGTIREDERSDA